MKYTFAELPSLVGSFLSKVEKQHTVQSKTSSLPWVTATKTIAVFGGVYADIFNRVAVIPKENEVALSDDFKISLGGKAANAAVALARLGNEVFICGRLGYDAIGNDLEAALLYENIRTDFLHQDRDKTTGMVSLAVNRNAKYSTIVHEAANVHLTKASVDRVFKEYDAGKGHFDCVYLTLEPQKEIVAYIVHEAAKRDLFIFCDAAPHVRPIDPSLLPRVTVVAPNQLEAQAITGVPVHDFTDAERAAKQLADYGAGQVLITLGDQGSYYVDGGEAYSIDALQVRATDEAGAGDAFRAAFVHGLLHGRKTKEALVCASAAGAYAVTHFGSYDSMPNSTQLDTFMSKQGISHAKLLS